jgi:hypothetical protein
VNDEAEIYTDDAVGNRIEANHISGTTGATSYGIRTHGSGIFILKNTCVGQVNNFSLDSDDTYGPVATSSGVLSGTSPWANFSRLFPCQASPGRA